MILLGGRRTAKEDDLPLPLAADGDVRVGIALEVGALGGRGEGQHPPRLGHADDDEASGFARGDFGICGGRSVVASTEMLSRLLDGSQVRRIKLSTKR